MIYDNTHNDGLYNPQFEHDNCGIGAIVNIKGIKIGRASCRERV